MYEREIIELSSIWKVQQGQMNFELKDLYQQELQMDFQNLWQKTKDSLTSMLGRIAWQYSHLQILNFHLPGRKQ